MVFVFLSQTRQRERSIVMRKGYIVKIFSYCDTPYICIGIGFQVWRLWYTTLFHFVVVGGKLANDEFE